MSSSIKDKTISGLGWSFTDNFFSLGINFIIGIILARLLSPQEFGLIGMVTVFIAISNSFVDSGLSQALIRKNDCTESDYSTVFYYNLIIGIVLYLLLFFFAGVIAEFFQEPKLMNLVRVLSLVLIIDSVGIIQRTILIKNINFKLQTKITIVASVIAGTVGILMAYKGFGVWSLVYKTLLLHFLTTILLWLLNNWRPKLLFSLDSFRDMFGFGSKLLIAGLIDRIFKNIYYLIIGRYFSAAELGFFTRAEQFKNIFSENISRITGRVTYPVLSLAQDDNYLLKGRYKKIIKSIMLITFTCMIGLAAVAKPLVLTLIGEQWLPSVPYLQLLCFAGMFFPLSAFNRSMLKVKGRSDLLLYLEIIGKVLIVPTVFIGIYFGIIEMLFGMVMVAFITYLLNAFWSGKMINYTLKEQIVDISPFITIASIIGVAVFLIGNVLTFEPTLLLITQVSIGIMIFIIIYEIFKFDTYLEMKEILFSYVKNADV